MRNFTWAILFIANICMAGGRDDASFVWADNKGEGRQVVVFFRNDVTLDAAAAKAEINLFADSRYHLFVNGVMINFGPGRFYPAHPQYDTYDIAPYLKKGKNTIAVKAMSNGVNTFQVPKHTGGFIAWGEVSDANGKTLSLATPGNWLCKPSAGYDREMPKATFALHICESYDARKDQPDWNMATCNTKDWKKTIKIAKQDNWGTLEPRTIPHLTQDDAAMKKLLGVYQLKEDFDIIACRVKVPDEEEKLYRSSTRLFAYTYIYSPKARKADIIGWWSEFWLNNDSVGYSQPENGLPKRIWHLDLKEGWNYLFVKYGSTDGIWEAFYKVPKSYGLIFSAAKDKNSDITFYTAGPFADAEKDKVQAIPLPFAPEKLPKLSAGWKAHYRSEICMNPVWEIALSELGAKQDYHQSHAVAISISKPSAITYDIGGKQLARFAVDIEAPEGTILDVAFTEDTLGERPWVMKRRMISMGARFITREGMNHFETFNPYGSRFVHVNIINNNNKPVILHQVKMISQVYPMQKKGSFECSDPMMTSLWEMGWRTLRVCSEDSYTDTPFRERGLYAGDALPEFATTLATAGDPLLVKRCLELFQDMYKSVFSDGETRKEKLGDFPLITTLYFGWYVDRTSDIEFAKKVYPSYKYMISVIGEKNTQTNGLVEAGGVFVEWTKIRRNDYSNTFFNAIYARNCEILADIALKLGKKEDAEWFIQKAKKVIAALNTYCWDAKKGAYYDGMVKDTPVVNYYPISSAIMSLFGYTSSQQEEKLKVFYDETLNNIGSKVRDGLATAYGGFYVLGGLYRQGYAGRAEHFIRRYYSPMMLYLDDTMWEDFAENSELLMSGTLSHAWSSAPTYYMTTEVLGVKLGFPSQQDVNTIMIEPQAESITWAKGDVPHPKGNIHVEWKINGDNLFLIYSVPAGMDVKVAPRGKLAQYTLWINGKKE